MASLSKKVCLLGEFAVGKTSLVRRFVYNRFDDKYISTIGVKVSRKTVAVPRQRDVVELTMMLWDLAGSEEFTQVRSSYLRGSAGAVLVCDLTRERTLTHLQHYIDDLLNVSPNTQIIVAANKSDLVDQYEIALEQVRLLAKQMGAPVYATSAREGNEVDALFRHLGKLLVR